MKGVKPGVIVLGCSQSTVGDGDEGDMPVERRKIPDLILIQAINFALFVIDFNGPAVTSAARDALGWPVQSVGDKERGRSRQVSLAVVDD